MIIFHYQKALSLNFKNISLKILQYSQEHICAGITFSLDSLFCSIADVQCRNFSEILIFIFIWFCMKLFPRALVSLLYKNLIFALLTYYFMIGNIVVQSWLIWATLHIASDLLFHQKFPFLSSDIKNVPKWKIFFQNTFQKCSHSWIFFKIGVLINFPIFTTKYLCWSLFNKVRHSGLQRYQKRDPNTGVFLWITKCFITAFLW